MNKDLTMGSPHKTLWLFCLPLLGSVIFQQLYNLADSFVAGRFIGENALASVGNSYEITLIFLAFAFGCNMGCSVVVAEFFGGKRYDKVKSAVYTCFTASIVTCLALMAIALIFARDILSLINTPEDLMRDSLLYLRIYIYGLPFVFLYNVSTGIFSALGDSKTPFIFLSLSSTANIVMDILFVCLFDMGVKGVALATFLCQGVSCVLAVIFVLKRLSKIVVNEKVKFFDKQIFSKFLNIAIPSTAQQGFVSVGNLVIQGIINGFGTAVIAGYSASIKLNNLVITSFTTLGNGISNYTAQNLGANKIERVKAGFLGGVKLVGLISLVVGLIYFALGESLMRLFINQPTDEALGSGKIFLQILSPFYILISIKIVADGILRGAGLVRYFVISTFVDLILRVIFAYLLSRGSLGVIGIWCAWPIGWVVATVMSGLFYYKYFVKRDRQSEW